MVLVEKKVQSKNGMGEGQCEENMRDVRFWMKVLIENLRSIHKLSIHDIKIMEEFQLDRPSFVEKIGKIVT